MAKQKDYKQVLELLEMIDKDRTDLTDQEHSQIAGFMNKIQEWQLYDKREKLYLEYVRELGKYTDRLKEENLSDDEVKKRARNLLPGGEKGDCTQWIDIVKDGKIVGFLIMSTAPECHPQTDYFLNQTYVKPKYRKQGLMSATLKKFISEHPGKKYSIVILRKNKWARHFWQGFFLTIGYTTMALSKWDGFSEKKNPDSMLLGYEFDTSYFPN